MCVWRAGRGAHFLQIIQQVHVEQVDVLARSDLHRGLFDVVLQLPNDLETAPRAQCEPSPLSYFLICHIVIPGAFPPARFPFAHLLPPWQTPVLPRDSARTSLREDSVPHGPRAVVGVCISKTRPASLQRKERVPSTGSMGQIPPRVAISPE